ncbi:hypothetical protein BJY04DRAFT_204773 [Aspergillus karnatakaensis]|uniref:uncharacterized protein n=1 Tax=Aspergillus karnatakaensis TaxID=1810916 RepID=UPI003CCD32EC
MAQSRLRVCRTKPRVFIISDISNEPDDAESLVRYLLYSNDFDTRGLVACTSTWMKRAVHPEDMLKIINAYDQVVSNLNHHVHPENQYSPGQTFIDMLRTGPALYGKEALNPDVPLSDGAKLLIDRVSESTQPIWILCWGGTNVLAQALAHVSTTLTAAEHRTFRAKLRVYAISDQDNTGALIRHKYPDIFYITSIHGWNQYGNALWTGISGDKFYGFDAGGPDSTLISHAWIRENIQLGILGKNGLGDPEHPEWGSWGGRYLPLDSSPGSIFNQYHDATDRLSPEIKDANHAPLVDVNGSGFGPEPLFLDVPSGSVIELDASRSYDPDGDELAFNWFHYKDVTATQWIIDDEVGTVEFEDLSETSGRVVRARLPGKCSVHDSVGLAVPQGQVLHLVLEVTDSGTPAMTVYKRVVLRTSLGGE